MSFTRRSFLVGTASGLSVLALAACTDQGPTPSPTPRPTTGPNEVPAPTAFSRSNWSSDPYALGATSYTAVGALPQSRQVLREPVLNRVFLAGEALSDDPGTVRGALASGQAAARRVLGVLGEGERVVIIGAGAAGAGAASILSAAGAQIGMIEARDRTGGRIASTVDGESVFELGAWRLEDVGDAEIVSALALEGLDVASLEGGAAYAGAAGEEPVELEASDAALVAASDSLGEAAAWAQTQPGDVSVADAVLEGTDPESWPAPDGVTTEALVDQVLLSVAGMTGADATTLSAWFATPTPNGAPVIPLGPLSSFVDAMLDDIDIVFSTAVTGISYDDDGVSLRLATGESITAARVILTAPLGVLQEQFIEFDPPLPVSTRGAINALSVGNIELVWMEYETPFWSTDAVWWIREDENEPIRTWVNLLPATGRPVLLGIVAGEAAIELAALDDDALEAAVRRSLEPFATS